MSTDSIHKPTSNAAQAETDNPPMALHGAPDRNVGKGAGRNKMRGASVYNNILADMKDVGKDEAGQEPLAGTYECCFCGIGLTEIHYSDERCYKCAQTDVIQRSTSLPFHAGFWKPDPAEDVENKVIANYAWGRILVITGYKQQKRLLEQKIAELPEAEVPRGLVSVQTIDDSPCHQAEFVICESVVLMQKDT
ncbi:hypothetical protein Trihar35433_9651 [Trichoderma harzianum]|nr:hypothetical protein Trihar35433_9651 [Trichoderma harzianum]